MTQIETFSQAGSNGAEDHLLQISSSELPVHGLLDSLTNPEALPPELASVSEAKVGQTVNKLLVEMCRSLRAGREVLDLLQI